MLLLSKQISFCILSTSLIASSQASHTFDNKENCLSSISKTFSQLSLKDGQPEVDQLRKQLVDIQQSNDRSHDRADLDRLFKNYRYFIDELRPNYSNQAWHQIAEELIKQGAIKGPAQQMGWEVAGGHLFFPSKLLHQWLETEYTDHLVGRRDMMWAYAIAAKFKHPLGGFYLTERFFKINQDYIQDYNHPLYNSFLKDAFINHGLNDCLDHPDTAYAVGYGQSHLKIGRIDKYNFEKHIDLHRRGKDDKNQLKVLELRGRCIQSITKAPVPQISEYLDLARQGYNVAYLKAINFATKNNEKALALTILQEAIDAHYLPAYIYKAMHEYRQDNDILGAQYLLHAGQQGLTVGFIKLAITLVGNIEDDNPQTTQRPTLQDYHNAAHYFKLAANAYDPLGYEYLGYLNYRLSLKAEDEDMRLDYQQQALNAWAGGCILGSLECYMALITYNFDKVYHQVRHEHRFTMPDEQFAKQLRKFINSVEY